MEEALGAVRDLVVDGTVLPNLEQGVSECVEVRYQPGPVVQGHQTLRHPVVVVVLRKKKSLRTVG